MTRDEIKTIADIVGGDDTYRHFVYRINKEFDQADQNRQTQVKVIFEERDGEKLGFAVVAASPAKMQTWEEIFKEENWVESDFSINRKSLELMYVYVKPEHRKNGLGKAMLENVFIEARRRGSLTVYAYVSDTNNSSLEFYKKMNANIIHDFSDEGFTTAFLSWDL